MEDARLTVIRCVLDLPDSLSNLDFTCNVKALEMQLKKTSKIPMSGMASEAVDLAKMPKSLGGNSEIPKRLAKV